MGFVLVLVFSVQCVLFVTFCVRFGATLVQRVVWNQAAGNLQWVLCSVLQRGVMSLETV